MWKTLRALTLHDQGHAMLKTFAGVALLATWPLTLSADTVLTAR